MSPMELSVAVDAGRRSNDAGIARDATSAGDVRPAGAVDPVLARWRVRVALIDCGPIVDTAHMSNVPGGHRDAKPHSLVIA
jgi:hypothetical protein